MGPKNPENHALAVDQGVRAGEVGLDRVRAVTAVHEVRTAVARVDGVVLELSRQPVNAPAADERVGSSEGAQLVRAVVAEQRIREGHVPDAFSTL